VAVSRVAAGRGNLRLLIAIVMVLGFALVAFGIVRSRRVAEFAPVAVVESKEPLQELPVRTAAGEDGVEPAHTYDAMLDLSSIETIVVGVDLDYVLKGLPRYDAVIRTHEGRERFRGRIEEESFRDGRFMLRLFADRFAAGDYTLDIEAFDDGAADGRIIASSWFQVSR
jgi:hypothetical protein